MKFMIGYGDTGQSLEVPDRNLTAVLTPQAHTPDRVGEDAVRQALQQPIGSPRLRDLVRPDNSVAVIVSDITRPVPSHKIVPAVLEELERGGMPPHQITIVFALGSHRPHTEGEMRRLVGDVVFERVHCVDGDPDDCLHLGTTARGTPVDVTRAVAAADFRIGVGNIEYHYFAGYSGGAKAIMPGVSSRRAIQANHSRMVLPGAEVGRLDGNPVREDIEEAQAFCSLDFIINVVLDQDKEIIHAAAGHHQATHRAGCRFLDSLYRISIPARADIVIASPGGFPKDINLYQAQKALENAKFAVKKGGIIILAASCREGMGDATFAFWLRHAHTPGDIGHPDKCCSYPQR